MQPVAQRDAAKGVVLALAVAVAWTLARAFDGANVVLHIATVLLLGAALRFNHRAEARTWVARCAFVVWLVAVVFDSQYTGDARMPPSLIYATMVPSLAAVVEGFGLAWTTCALAIGVHLGVMQGWYPEPEQRVFVLRRNTIGETIWVGLLFVTFVGTFRRLGRALEERGKAIEQSIEERSELVRVLTDGLGGGIQKMRSVLEADSARKASEALRREHAAVSELLGKTRERFSHSRPPPDESWRDALPRFRLTMTRWLLAVVGGLSALLVAMIYVTGRGMIAPALAATVATLALLVAVLLRPKWQLGVVVCAAVVIQAGLLWSFAQWGTTELPPTVVSLGATYHAVLIGPAIAGVVIVGVQLITLGYFATSVDTLDAWTIQVIVAVAVVLTARQISWFRLQGRIKSYLAALELETNRLERLDRSRERISGTLFHDVANPLHAIGWVLPPPDGPLDEKGAKHIAGLLDRIDSLSELTSRLVRSNEASLLDRTKSVRIDSIVSDLEDVFGHRLAEKDQTLSIRLPRDSACAVRVVPELLRDCVLANLISNAIKFSPKGTTIELLAERRADQIRISVRDQGPGFPEKLGEQLRALDRIRSTAGTEGERGLGLGLTLCQEYLTRMGGKLSIDSGTVRGGVATISIPLTPSVG